MSTDLRDRTSNPSPREEPDEKPKSSLSLTQVVGGALAAMTAAALGSRLSVAGTVVGAALASVIAAVAGAVYTSSLRRTSETVSTVWKTRVRPDGHGGTTTVMEAVTDERAEGDADTASETRLLPRWDDEQPHGIAAAPAVGRRGPRIGWKPMLVAAVLMFAVAAVALTGLELATGRALSGGNGTTVGQVAEGGSEPTTKPSSKARTKATPTPSASATDEPSATASPTPSNQRTADPTPTLSARPTPSATPTPSSTPTSTPASGASAPAATPGS